MPRGRKLAFDQDEFVRDWNGGMPQREIAAKHRMSQASVYTYSLRLGCARRNAECRPGRRQDSSPDVLSVGQWVTDGRGVKRWEAWA